MQKVRDVAPALVPAVSRLIGTQPKSAETSLGGPRGHPDTSVCATSSLGHQAAILAHLLRVLGEHADDHGIARLGMLEHQVDGGSS